jgi:formylglycine-generating enzyme required for sulfatase activity
VAAQRARKTDVYLAPEFLAGHAIEPSADVYSMGVILGEMLSGQLPIAGRLPDLLAANPDLPPAVEGLYRRCLAANPTSRVPSAAEFASELLALSEASAPPIPKPGAAGVVVAPLPPSGPTIPKARPRPPPPPPREPSGDIVLHTGDFEVRTDVDEQFTPPDSGPKLPPSPPTIVDRQGTRPSRIARPLRPVREPHPPREPGAIPIDTPGNISRGNISRPRPTPSAPPVADAGAKRRRWIIIGVIAALLVGVGLYGGVRALLSWQAKEKSQLEAQIRADFERQQRLLAAQAADAGTGTVTPPPAPDAGHPPLAVAAPDAGPKRTPPTPPSNPTPPSHPPREHEEHVIVAHEVAAGGCPEGMRTVRGGAFRMGTPGSDDLGNFGDRPERRVSVRSYCIDAYEYPNQADVKPKVGVTLSAAETACASEGKRLCSEEEWEKACKGPDNLRFPYGHAFSSQACNGGRGGLAAAGSFAGCKSGYGVYDLSGNAAEWTSSRFQSGASDRAVKGGSFGRSDTDLRCSARQNKAPGSHSGDVGFRCCEDLK